MYITANWLYQPKTEVRGLNVDIHLNPGGVLTGSKDTVGPVIKHANQTGGEAVATYYQMTPGNNRVEAYLDLVFEDADYSFELVKLVLERAKRAVLDSYVPIVPLPFEVVLESKKVLGVYGTNLDVMTEDATEVIFRMLSGVIVEALWKNRDKLKEGKNTDIWDHLRKEAAATRLELDQALAERAKLEDSQRRLSAKICANRKRLSAADEAHSKVCGELDYIEGSGDHE